MKLPIKSNVSLGEVLAVALPVMLITPLVVYVANRVQTSGECVSWLVVLVMLVLCLVPVIRKGFRLSEVDPFEPVTVFAILSFIYFVFSPVYSVLLYDYQIFGLEYLGKVRSIALFNATMAWIAVSIAIFYLGYYTEFPRGIARRLPFMHFDRESVWFPLILGAYTLFGFLCFLGIIYMFHGLPVFSGFARSELAKGKGQYLLAGISFLKLILYVLLVSFLLKQKHPKRDYLWMFLYFFFVFALFVGIGSRTRTFDMFVVMACIYHYTKRRFQLKTMMVTGLIMLVIIVIVFPALKLLYNVHMLQSSKLFGSEFQMDLVFESQKLMFYDKIPQLAALVLNVPDKIGLQWGNTLPAFVDSFLPKNLESVLPFVDEADIFMETLYPDVYELGVGYPITIFGVLYMNFHVVGAFGMYLFGVAWRVLYEYLRANPTNKSVIIIYAIVLYHMYGLYGGNLTHGVKFTIIEALPLLLALFLISKGRLVVKGSSQGGKVQASPGLT